MRGFVCVICIVFGRCGGQDLAGSLQVPALGRSFSLGDLYDVRQDKLVAPGVTLWNQETLKKNLEIQPAPYTDTMIITTNSLEEKANAFDISAELKASFIGGLVKVKGAASYLRDQARSNYAAEVSFRYKRKTHMRKLTMEHLANIEYPTVFDKYQEPTHVVTKIVYGANSVFRFSREAQSYSEAKELHGELQLAVQFVAASIEGTGSIDLTEEQKKNYRKIKVEFRGDVPLTTPPTTLEDAIKVYRNLPSLINSGTAIPVEVHLHPMSKLDTKASRIIRRVSEGLLTQVERRMEVYNKLFRDIGDVKHTESYKSFARLQFHMSDFQSALRVQRNQFQRDLLRVLPAIRGRGMEEIELTKVLDEAGSPFSMAKIQRWIDWKKREAGALKSLAAWRPQLVLTKPGQFEALLYDEQIQHILAFKVKLYPREDGFTSCMMNRCANVSQYVSWMESGVTQSLRSQFKHYRDVVDIHTLIANRYKTKFAIIEAWNENLLSEEPTINVELYENGFVREKDFRFPKIFDVEFNDIRCETTNVSWATDNNGMDHWISQGFLVKYKKLIASDWTIVETVSSGINMNVTPSKVMNPDFFTPLIRDQHETLWRRKSLPNEKRFELVITVKCKFGACAVYTKAVQEIKDMEQCPKDCELSNWSAWSACSKTCNEGTQLRSRTIIKQASNGGLACSTLKLTGSQKCHPKDCEPKDCVVLEWTSWSGCSVTCGSGTKSRNRKATAEAEHGGKGCSAFSLEETLTCSKVSCSRPPAWFINDLQLEYKWWPDGDAGQCAGGPGTKTADVGTWTSFYRDDTDGRGGGCRMQWRLNWKKTNAGGINENAAQICFKYRADGDGGQCGPGVSPTCAKIGTWTATYRDDTDGRGGGCQLSWMLKVEDNQPWKINVGVEYKWHPDGDGGQCGGGAPREIKAIANQWTREYRDDSDGRGGGCQMSWRIFTK